MKAIGLASVAAIVIGAAVLAGCDAQVPSGAPNPRSSPTTFALKPAVRMDPSWQSSNGLWTFTGQVDPEFDSTDVVLEIGPGPATARQFDQRITVAQDLTAPGALTITTRDIPDIDDICVRFAATNSAGTSFTTPLCFPHDLPSFVIDEVPPTAEFSTPAVGTTTILKTRSYTVAWSETEEGSGISRRSLQRQIATYAGGACGAYTDDGPAILEPSPVVAPELLDGKCYQWIETLSDRSGNKSAATSGTVRVDLGTPG
jgi:hypothetical protein